jgi:Restriction endonuclease EcoRII, N-terminal
MHPRAIEKTLSANDTGETGGHQAGILVPKGGGVLSFFPRLDPTMKNPRAVIDVMDDAGRDWALRFIYYNNRFFGGTRNEYRLTGMTAFFREFNLKAGDKVILIRESPRRTRITFKRARSATKVLRLSVTWKIIDTGF